jgi:hypothetical protein
MATVGNIYYWLPTPRQGSTSVARCAVLGVSSSKFIAAYPYSQVSATNPVVATVGTVNPVNMEIVFASGEYLTTNPSESVYELFHRGELASGLWKLGPDKYVAGFQGTDGLGNHSMRMKALYGDSTLTSFAWPTQYGNPATYNDVGEICQFTTPDNFGAVYYVVGGSGGVKVSILSASATNNIDVRATLTGSAFLTGGYPYKILTIRDFKVCAYNTVASSTPVGFFVASYSLATNAYTSSAETTFARGPYYIPGDGFSTSDGKTFLVPFYNATPSRAIYMGIMSAEGGAFGITPTCSFTASANPTLNASENADSIWAVRLGVSQSLSGTVDTFALVWRETDNNIYARKLYFVSGAVPQSVITGSQPAFKILSSTSGYQITIADRLYVSPLDNDSIVITAGEASKAIIWAVRFNEEPIPPRGTTCQVVGADNVFGVKNITWKY